MTRRVATITLNPAFDLLGQCQAIERNEVNRVTTVGMFPAGKGINVAKVLKDLGADVTVTGFLGNKNLDDFQLFFLQEGITNHFHTVLGRTRVNVKLTEQNGYVTDLNFSGFTISATDWDVFAKSSLKSADQYDIISVNGSLPPGIPYELFAEWMIKLKEKCPQLIFDSSGDTLLSGLKAKPWLIKPNRRELEIWSGKELNRIDDVIYAAHALRKQGIAHVVISLGENGALWASPNGTWLAKPPACKTVVSTVGAGDSMVAGFIYGLLTLESHDYTLRLATAISALSVGQTGVGIKDHALLDEMLMKVEIKKID